MDIQTDYAVIPPLKTFTVILPNMSIRHNHYLGGGLNEGWLCGEILLEVELHLQPHFTACLRKTFISLFASRIFYYTNIRNILCYQ